MEYLYIILAIIVVIAIIKKLMKAAVFVVIVGVVLYFISGVGSTTGNIEGIENDIGTEVIIHEELV